MHRVYVRWDEGLFVAAQRYPEPLPTDASEYRAVQTESTDVCTVTPAGERLCDFGPDHPHPEN